MTNLPECRPERNDPMSALAIRLLVGTGVCTQAQADAAFSAACTMLEQEAVSQNLSLPWVMREPARVLTEHSGCGQGAQVDQISVTLHPGDKVLLVMGKYSAALAKT